jgi:hypothetical protein
VAHFSEPLLHPDYAENEDQPEDEHSDVHHEWQGLDQGRDLQKIDSEIPRSAQKKDFFVESKDKRGAEIRDFVISGWLQKRSG